MTTGHPDTRLPQADCTHRTRTNTRAPLEPIGYDTNGAPIYAWQLTDEDPPR